MNRGGRRGKGEREGREKGEGKGLKSGERGIEGGRGKGKQGGVKGGDVEGGVTMPYMYFLDQMSLAFISKLSLLIWCLFDFKIFQE